MLTACDRFGDKVRILKFMILILAGLISAQRILGYRIELGNIYKIGKDV